MNQEVALTGTPLLDMLAEDAREGLRKVAQGEHNTLMGWLDYGRALNEGRKFSLSNNLFHDWLVSHQLDGTNDMDRLAAMWAAANTDAFIDTIRMRPNVRTVRGLHAKFKEAQRVTLAATFLDTLEVDAGPTITELRTSAKLKAIAEHPSTGEPERAAAQRKLDAMDPIAFCIGNALSFCLFISCEVTSAAIPGGCFPPQTLPGSFPPTCPLYFTAKL